MIETSKILLDLTPVFRNVFNDPGIELTTITSVHDIGAWDSLTHMQLIHEIEARYNVRFNLEEVMHIANAGDIVSLLQQKITT